MQRSRATWLRLKKIQKISILDKIVENYIAQLRNSNYFWGACYDVLGSQHFLLLLWLKTETLIALGSLHFYLHLQLESETLLSDLAVIYLVLHNNFFYTQLAFVFHLRTDFYSVHDNILGFYVFLLLKDFDTFHEHIGFFLKKLINSLAQSFYIYLGNIKKQFLILARK